LRYLTVGRPESQRRDLLITAALAFISLFIAGLSVESRLVITRVARSTVLAPFLSAHRVFARSADLSDQVAFLTGERERLAAEVLESANLELENRQLRIIAGLPERRTGGFAMGELTAGAPEWGVSHTFLFRVRSGVEPATPAGISSPQGLVGVLRTADGDSGIGEFWTHPDFRVGVRTPNGATTGILRPYHAEGGETLMLLDGIPYQTSIASGTLLETSGEGGVHPPGVPVGRVIREESSRSGWSHSYLVDPIVRPGQVRIGLVWLVDSLMPPAGEPGGTEEVPGEGDAGATQPPTAGPGA
jgi:cell shape-determining protein MreC